MKIAITPDYQEIFNEEVPDLHELIKDIPTNGLISYLSYINSKLYLNTSIECQIEIMNEMLARQSSETKLQIKDNLRKFISTKKSPNGIGLITKFHILSFMHYALCNFSDFDMEDTTPVQELNIFKAYMVIVNIKSEKIIETNQREIETVYGDFFQEHTWPILFNQSEAISENNSIPDLFKAICFFNYLQYHSPYGQYVSKFISENGQSNPWEYVMSISNLITQRWNKEKNNETKIFSFHCIDKTKPFYDSLCIDPKTYGQTYLNRKEDHILMKAKPLLKYRDRYIVLDWDYFSNKLYDGLVFDFFYRSGINEIPEINTIPKFKKLIGKEITENFTFRKLLTGLLTKSYAVLNFPTGDSNGEPDGYYREGNKIILFEIKDAYFAGDILISNSVLQIKSEINKKYNNSKKGTGQLIKQIQRLKENSFENKSYSDLQIKPRNFKIYPVIVYTDNKFGVPGVSNYLISEFDDQASQLNLKDSFKRIEKLTFISLSLLILHFNFIKKIGFFNMIEMLHQELEKRKRKHEFKMEIDNMFRFNSPPEQIIEELINCNNDDQMGIEELAKVLNILEGLPK